MLHDYMVCYHVVHAADMVHYCPKFDSSLATEIVGDKTNETYHKLSSVLHPEYPVYSRHHQHIKDLKQMYQKDGSSGK